MKLSNILRSVARVIPAMIGVLALVAVVAWMSGAFRAKIPPGDLRRDLPVDSGHEVVETELLKTTESVEAVGTVEPRRQTAVASQVLAVIREVRVNAGDRVEADQVLVTLDDRELRAQLREAEAAVAVAQADLTIREGDFGRYKKMYAEKAVTKEDYDRVEGSFQVSKAQLRRAKEQVARMDVMLSYTQIKAQSSGIIADRYADPGDLASPGKPLLALHDPRDLELHASVRESLASSVRVGMKLPVRIEAAVLELEGTVREIVPQAQAASRSVLVKILLPAEQLTGLYIGMFGRVSIPVGQTERVVVLSSAVQFIGQLETVNVVGEIGTVERRFVRTGRRFGDKTEILSGLAVGERVARIEPGP